MEIVAYTIICSFASFLFGIAFAFPFVVARRARKAFEHSIRSEV